MDGTLSAQARTMWSAARGGVVGAARRVSLREPPLCHVSTAGMSRLGTFGACVSRSGVRTHAAGGSGRRFASAAKGGSGRGGKGVKGAQASSSRKADRLGIAVFSTIVAGTLAAGVWQVRRYHWKVDLVAAREARLQAPVVPISGDTLHGDALYMQHISLRGRFLHDKEVFIGPRSPPAGASHEDTNGEKSGWALFTPFETEDGLQVIVNRGWIPARTGRGDGISRPTQVFDLLAVVQLPEQRTSALMPDNDMANGQVFWADVPALARRAGFRDPDTCCLIDAVEPWSKGEFPLPRGLEAYRQFHVTPFKHVVYATTWFCLAAAGSVMTFIKFRR